MPPFVTRNREIVPSLSHARRANVGSRRCDHFESTGHGRNHDVSGWAALLAAGLLEVGWALGLKYSDGLTRFWPTAATVATSPPHAARGSQKRVRASRGESMSNLAEGARGRNH